MTIITKAALAAELGVTKARVSQYVKRGLPVRSDGKLDRETAVKWISDNFVDRGNGRAVGAKRAAAAAKRVKSKPAVMGIPITLPAHAVTTAFAEISGQAHRAAGQEALRLGLPVRTAFMLDQLVGIAVTNAAEEMLDRLGAPVSVVAGLTSFEAAMQDALKDREAEWPGLAEQAGETYQEDAWWDALGPYLTPIEA